MSTHEYQARTERLVDWLEAQRRMAGLTQEQVAQLAGISHSYYSKIASSWRSSPDASSNRKRHVSLPDTSVFHSILTGLKEKLGERVVEEGFAILNPTTCPTAVSGPFSAREGQLMMRAAELIRKDPDRMEKLLEL
jgi:hypothetical protein